MKTSETTSELFSSQARSHVETLLNGMRALERQPGAVEQLDACMRAARSIKTVARIAGIHASAELADAMENCFLAARRYEVALCAEQIGLMFRSVDLIERLASLPATDDEQPAPAEKPDPVRQRSRSSVKLAKRVLVVDDSPGMREFEAQLLSVGGYEVETAADGVDAWKAVGARHFDLVLTDIEMPLLDGLELTKLIRADARFRLVRVVVACGEEGDTDRWRAFDVGADYYVIKDSLERKLVQTVASLIGPPQ